MEQLDVQALEEAVLVFYRSGATQHAAAHDWLTKAQTSPQAWSFVWQLMTIGKTSEIQFFGATTLHCKLVRYWSEVPKENYQELKEKLMDTIIAFGSGPRIVLNRLCISFSAFIVQMYEDWPTAIEDISHSLQTQTLPNVAPKMQIWILMEILCAVPDEALAITTSVQRANMRGDLAKKAPYVLGLLETYLQSKCNDEELDTQDIETLQVAAKCASAWLRNYAFPLDTCTPLATSMVKLVNKCYWKTMKTDGCLSSEENELTNWCLETLTAMLIQPDAHRYSNSALAMIQLYLDSLTPITKAENIEDNPNEDIVSAIYTLFVTSIESHSRALIAGVIADSPQHQSIFQRLIDQVLQCTDKPGIYPLEESCSSISMGFWYMLQEEVLSSEDVNGRCKMLTIIRPIYAHLTRILVRKSQQPDDDQIEKWSSDELEMFRCYRQDICDTLLYCHEVLHDELLRILMDMILDSVSMVRADSRNWCQLEAGINAYCAVAEQVDNDERKYTPQLMKLLGEIPYAQLNEKLLGTALETIGAFNEWFKDNKEFLPGVIDLLVSGLSSTQASQATLGLKDICYECQEELREYTEPLLHACQQSLAGGKLTNSESVRLMFSVGKLMSMLPDDKLLPCLDTLVSPCFKELQTILQSGRATQPLSDDATFQMNMISTLFSSLNTKTDRTKGTTEQQQQQQPTQHVQPVLFVMQKTMPIFQGVCDMFVEYEVTIEHTCNALRQAVLNLQNDCIPMLAELCCVIVSILRQKIVPSAVELARTCILSYYRERKCAATVLQLHAEVYLQTMRVLDATPDELLSDQVDVINAFHTFNGQIVKKLPEVYKNPAIDCTKLLHFAIRSLLMPEPALLKHTIAFIVHFVTQSRSFEPTTMAVRTCGSFLVRTVLDCVGVHTTRTHIEQFADILLALSKKYAEDFLVWMKLLEVTGYPSALISAAEKEHFMKVIVKEKANKRIIQAQIREFAAKCRGLPEKM